MAFLSDATNRKTYSTALEDLDYDEFLSEPKMSEAAATSYEIPPPPPGITVTVHLDNNPRQSTTNNLATRSTIPTATYTMLSTLVATRK